MGGPTDKPDWDERLTKAFARKLATSDFSQAAAVEAASSALEEVLRNAANIELDEGKRQLMKSHRKSEYRQLADYASKRYGQNKYLVEEVLQNADTWPFRVLQEAKKIRKKQNSPDGLQGGLYLKDR